MAHKFRMCISPIPHQLHTRCIDTPCDEANPMRGRMRSEQTCLENRLDPMQGRMFWRRNCSEIVGIDNLESKRVTDSWNSIQSKFIDKAACKTLDLGIAPDNSFVDVLHVAAPVNCDRKYKPDRTHRSSA